ncbi:HhH-GPD-type base excision DNA repair protein [Flindersiella endophytica]
MKPTPKPAAKPAKKTAAKPPAAKATNPAVVTLAEPPTLNIVGDPAADAELARNPFSLLTGMLLDQQFPMERAFAGPYVIIQRLGADTLDPQTIAAYDPEAFVKLCQGPPAVHRYPGAMAARIQELARIVLDEYDGDSTRIWSDGTAKEIVQRLRALPGFGPAKATIFLALLGKRFGVKPRGWVTETGPLGKPTAYRSVADVVDTASLAKVRATKQEMKKRAKQEKAG